MSQIIDWLNSGAFTIIGEPTTWAELLGFITGLLCVFYVARNNILTFPVGIFNAAFFFVLFIDAKLYADAWLQVFFIVVQFVGWWAWLKAGPNRTELVVSRAKPAILVLTAIAGVAAFFILVPILRDAHGAYPHWDSATTTLSIAAQTLMSWRYIQHWLLWIAADLIYIPLYWVKGLHFTSILYVLFLTLCVLGLRHWRRVEQHQIENPVLRPVGPVQVVGEELPA
jgi:nicotinamide mononucleotide transporter